MLTTLAYQSKPKIIYKLYKKYSFVTLKIRSFKNRLGVSRLTNLLIQFLKKLYLKLLEFVIIEKIILDCPHDIDQYDCRTYCL